MRTSTNQLTPTGILVNGFDYKNQAWVINGVYTDCGHPKAGEIIPARTDFYIVGGQRHEIHFPARQAVDCNCYGRAHAGEECNVSGNV